MESKMTDSEHLCWIVGRLINVHGENPNVDYMVKLQNIAQKLDLPVGKINPKADEWPKVGDEFLHEGKLVNCIAKGSTNKGDDVVTFESKYGSSIGTCWNNGHWVKKPKTEAEILRDEFISTMDDSTTAFAYADHFVKHLIDNYNITKKPQ